jgi:hypothetical protein
MWSLEPEAELDTRPAAVSVDRNVSRQETTTSNDAPDAVRVAFEI